MAETETYASGDPKEYIVKGIEEIPSNSKSAHPNLSIPISEQYNVEITEETANILGTISDAIDSQKLLQAVSSIESPTLDRGELIEKMDRKLSNAVVSRDKPINEAISRKNRETVYIPDIILNSQGGSVFMAKTLTSTTKVRIARDLNEDNVVIVVDEYEKWENAFGWRKLKSLPHGKNKIRRELGHRLSDELLDDIASGVDTDTHDTDTTDSSNRGRRTRTAPTDEVINVARGSAHRMREKKQAKEIKEAFDSDGKLDNNVQMLVLFPTTTDLNMTDHWWVAGLRWNGGGNVAIANCNKGTFEYLNNCDEVWHINDYLEQSESYMFDTNIGTVSIDSISNSENLVLHLVPEDVYNTLHSKTIIETIPDILPEYCDKNIFRGLDMPHPDEMIYAPITKESLFWLRPAVREMQPDLTILYANSSPRDVGTNHSLSSNYKLYARARLPNWDFDGEELETLDALSYRLSLNEGGYELVETLAQLHDAGMSPYSQTPKSRWDK